MLMSFSTFHFFTSDFFWFIFFFMSLVLCIFFSNSLMFFEDNWYFCLSILTFWIFLLMFLTLYFYTSFRLIFPFLLLYSMLLFCFFSTNLLSFFFFFESTLLPIFLIINRWGSHKNRFKASLYMFIFMIFSSLPFLIFLLFYMSELFVPSFFLLYLFNKPIQFSWADGLFSVLMIGCFLVKMPIYYTHIWLPQAHVEAPVFGSMILAALLLKLGCLGIYRVGPFIPLSNIITCVILVTSMLGVIYLSIHCFRQSDIKSLIAYSSVVHMIVALGGLFLAYSWSVMSALMISIGHGITSSFLFFLSSIHYNRISSRSVYTSSSMKSIYSYSFFIWLMAVLFNMSFPPFLGFISEFSFFNAMFFFSKLFIIPLVFMMIFTSVYNILLLQNLIFLKKSNKILMSTSSFIFLENFISSLHIFLMFFFSIYLIIYF